jgi:hypothetical protein
MNNQYKPIKRVKKKAKAPRTKGAYNTGLKDDAPDFSKCQDPMFAELHWNYIQDLKKQAESNMRLLKMIPKT